MSAAHQAPETVENKTDILGIISIILAVFGFALIGLIVGLIGASKAKKEGRSPVVSRVGWIMSLVFTILGLLLLSVFLSIPALQRNTVNNTRKNDVVMLQSELMSYYSEHQHYPNNLSQIESNVRLGSSDEDIYIYTPSPAGCVECQGYVLSTPLKGSSELYTVTSDY